MSMLLEGFNMLIREEFLNEYLDWLNNYLSIDKFAEHRGLTVEEAETYLKLCKSCFDNKHPEA